MSDIVRWAPTRSGQFLHIDHGMGFSVCGVGLLDWRTSRLPEDKCGRCIAWYEARR